MQRENSSIVFMLSSICLLIIVVIFKYKEIMVNIRNNLKNKKLSIHLNLKIESKRNDEVEKSRKNQ
jgi:hypothetical protein